MVIPPGSLVPLFCSASVIHLDPSFLPCFILPLLRCLLSCFESQNHRMVEVGRDLWRSSGPTPVLKQGHLELVAQAHGQMAFEYLQGWRLHNLPGQPVPVFSHPHSEIVFP